MTLLGDWINFKSNGGLYKPDHFAMLLREHHTSPEIQQICEGILNEGHLNRKMKVLLEDSTISDDGYAVSRRGASAVDFAKQTLVEYVENLQRLLRNRGFCELAAELGVDKIMMGQPVDLLRLASDYSHPHHEVLDVIGDIFRESYIEREEICLALTRAILSISPDLELFKYLLSDLTSLGPIFDPYYNLWRGGYSYFASSGSLILIPR